ncbi:MAG TPA: methyltransferase [Parafilimonas sp.]|nr:methyltransferase [Parafilimonas sp.]
METSAQQHPDPSKIMQTGMGFFESKSLLAAIKFGVFTLLANNRKMKGTEIKASLGLQTTDRHVFDWLDALTSLGFLERDNVLNEAVYSNSPDTEIFLDKNKFSYIGGLLEMCNNRLYNFWGLLEEGLLTGEPQNETKGNLTEGGFEKLYASPERLQEFMDAMSSIQTGNFMALADKFDFSPYKTLTDAGGADGWLSIQLCLKYPHLKCITFDLPPVEPLAKKKIAQFNLSGRIEVRSGDFTKDDIPGAEIITMGNIIHGFNEEDKQKMIQKVYDTLQPGGVFITIENIIDNDRRQNTFGLLMSLNMLIENGDAFDYTPSDFNRWAANAGFSKTEFIPLAGPASAAIAYK